MTETPFSRTQLLLGEAAGRALAESFVAIVGLGAVGGYAAEALARAGVGRFRLVDFDTVRPSNINRQLCALHSTLDQSKVELAAARVRDINPGCRVEAVHQFFNAAAAPAILAGEPSLVIDAIDSLNTKVDLIAAASERGLPIISSMGAARRVSPAAVKAARLRDAHGCPLARLVRKRLRHRGIEPDSWCVYSAEHIPRMFAIQARGADPVLDPGQDRGRVRPILGSLSTVTGIFGLTLAHAVLELLLGEVVPGFRKLTGGAGM